MSFCLSVTIAYWWWWGLIASAICALLTCYVACGCCDVFTYCRQWSGATQPVVCKVVRHLGMSDVHDHQQERHCNVCCMLLSQTNSWSRRHCSKFLFCGFNNVKYITLKIHVTALMPVNLSVADKQYRIAFCAAKFKWMRCNSIFVSH